MFRIRVLLGLTMALVLAGGWVLGDDPKPAAKSRGLLPPNWNKLGLTDEQKQKVYEVQGEYRAKIEALQAQVKQLQKQERGELEKLLTDAQKVRLREIVTTKALGESAPDKKAASSGGDEKKTDSKPAPDKK